MSQAGVLSVSTGGGSVVETLTGNSGGAVGPDGAFNINVIGNNTSGINIVGMPASNTLTVIGIQSSTTQRGTIVLASNAQTIAGSSAVNAVTPNSLAAKLGTQTAHSLAVFEGTSSALTALGAATNGQIPIGSTGADPVLANLTSSGGTITITNGAGTINLDLAGGTVAVDSFSPDSGTDPVVPTAAGLVNLKGSGSITTVGSLNTITTQLTGLTNHALLVGAGTSTITKVGPTATAGQVLQSAGAAADPAFSTATYPSTTTINQILYSSANNVIGGITASIDGVLISSHTGIPSWLANSGTAGFVLTANAGAPPSWQAGGGGGGGITTIAGDTGGGATGATVTFTGNIVSSSTSCGLAFDAAVSTVTASIPFLTFETTDNTGVGVISYAQSGVAIPYFHNYLPGDTTGQNIFVGGNAGNFTLTTAAGNSGLGKLSLNALTTGQLNSAVGLDCCLLLASGNNNAAIGAEALSSLISGSGNTALGSGTLVSQVSGDNNLAAGLSAATGISSGHDNVILGAFSCANANGNYNIVIGSNAGITISGTDSSNIIISHPGVAGDSNTIRIGTAGSGDQEQSTCYIAGIDGVTVTGTAVLCSTAGQLGTVASSKKFKDDIKPLSPSNDFMKLQPVSFTYKQEKEKYTHYGLIAEDVEKIFPDLVAYDEEFQPYSIKYWEMPALLLVEIQKLKEEIEELKKNFKQFEK